MNGSFTKYTLSLATLLFLGCEAADIVDPVVETPKPQLETKTFKTENTIAGYVYFRFSADSTIHIESPQSSMEWDIAFNLTTIKVNGGTSGPGAGAVAILKGVNFEDINSVPDTARFVTDDSETTGFAIPTGTNSGWYHYTGAPNHWILPLSDRVFVFRTAENKYAKVRILSYYSDGLPPKEVQQLDSGYYTFDYVYQTDGTGEF